MLKRAFFIVAFVLTSSMQMFIEPHEVLMQDKNGAVYEIEATDDVHLGEGFIVENGATFAIKTPGKVTIDGCVFQSGAKVKIEAGNVEVIGKFTAERGSKVEFTQYVDE